ncbi:MAG: hypothetical protein AMXMBFR66_13610 [Pseudomonadota bacterium]|nr:TRAP transporter substrate-binding protein DctP [Rubrivivax sp.]
MQAILRVFAFLLVQLGVALPGTGFAQQPAAASPIVLRKADFGPATQTRTTLSMWWARELEQRSQGRVKVQYFPADSLVKASDVFEATRSGVVDIGIWVQAYNPAVSPLSAVFTLPGISPNFRPAVLAASELMFDSPFSFFRDELRRLGVEPLYVWGVADQELIGTRPLTGIGALKGLKVRVIGREWPKLMSEFGAVPVTLPWPEVYEALGRGTLDANMGFITANWDSKLYEVAKQHTRIRLGAAAGPLAIMNKAAWDKLPDDVKAIVRQLAREFPDKLADLYEREVDKAVKEMEGKGVKFYAWPQGDRDKLQAAMEALWQGWAVEQEAKGLPAREALRQYLALLKKHTR